MRKVKGTPKPDKNGREALHEAKCKLAMFREILAVASSDDSGVELALQGDAGYGLDLFLGEIVSAMEQATGKEG